VVSGSSKEQTMTISFEILSKLLSEAKGKGSTDLVKQLGTKVSSDVKAKKTTEGSLYNTWKEALGEKDRGYHKVKGRHALSNVVFAHLFMVEGYICFLKCMNIYTCLV
jgi:hypothetical protein